MSSMTPATTTGASRSAWRRCTFSARQAMTSPRYAASPPPGRPSVFVSIVSLFSRMSVCAQLLDTIKALESFEEMDPASRARSVAWEVRVGSPTRSAPAAPFGTPLSLVSEQPVTSPISAHTPESALFTLSPGPQGGRSVPRDIPRPSAASTNPLIAPNSPHFPGAGSVKWAQIAAMPPTSDMSGKSPPRHLLHTRLSSPERRNKSQGQSMQERQVRMQAHTPTHTHTLLLSFPSF